MSGFRAPLGQFVSQRARRSDDPRFVPPVVIGAGLNELVSELEERIEASKTRLDGATAENIRNKELIEQLYTRLQFVLNSDEYESSAMEIETNVEELAQLSTNLTLIQNELAECRASEQALQQQMEYLRQNGRPGDLQLIRTINEKIVEREAAESTLLAAIGEKDRRIEVLRQRVDDLLAKIEQPGGLRRKRDVGDRRVVATSGGEGGGGGGGQLAVAVPGSATRPFTEQEVIQKAVLASEVKVAETLFGLMVEAKRVGNDIRAQLEVFRDKMNNAVQDLPGLIDNIFETSYRNNIVDRSLLANVTDQARLKSTEYKSGTGIGMTAEGQSIYFELFEIFGRLSVYFLKDDKKSTKDFWKSLRELAEFVTVKVKLLMTYYPESFSFEEEVPELESPEDWNQLLLESPVGRSQLPMLEQSEYKPLKKLNVSSLHKLGRLKI